MSAATRFILLKGTTAQRTSYTPKEGELVYDIDLQQVYIGDGSTAGGNVIGNPLTNEQVQDVVGSLIGDSTTIDVTYDDSGNVLTMEVIPSALNTSDFNNDADFQTGSEVSIAISNHESATDPHSQYLTETEADLLYEPLGAGASVFGSEFGYNKFTTTVSFSTRTLFQIYQLSATSRPPGIYRIMINYAYEPGSNSSNDISEIRVNGSTANIEQNTFEDEGKDNNSDIMRVVNLLGYYNKTTTGAFTIELYARNEGGTTVVKGAIVELWRVS